MRKYTVILGVLALIWGGYWFIGARALEAGLTTWIDGRRADGWAADYASLDTRGFPNRFDTTITDLRLADPETGLAWTLPFFQIFALTYRPHHIIAVLPDTQTLASPLERLEITSDDIRGSLRFRPNTSLALERTDVVADQLVLRSSRAWQATLDQGRFAIHRASEAETTYRLGADLVGLRPAEGLRRALDPTGRLPEVVDTLRLDATVSFDRPWDRFAIEDARPQPTEIDLTNVQATWGQLDLQVAGQLTIDPRGLADGQIAIKATNWREMIEIGIASGMLPPGIAATLESGLESVAGLSGRADTLDLPLTFRAGRISLGFIPLGDAPRFVIR